MLRIHRALAATPILFALFAACSGPDEPIDSDEQSSREHPTTVRIALFNIRELRTEKLTDVDEDRRGRNPQTVAAAQIIRRIAPDVLVLNEIDHDDSAADQGLDLNARRFRDLYLAETDGLELPYSFAAPNNTGRLSGLDLDGDGTVASDADRGSRMYGNDAWGYGTYPGEYSMAVLSRYPIVDDQVRSFQRFLWHQLPGHHIPADYFSPEIATAVRLSSKSHWDLPITVEGRVLRLLVSHPTPQGFDGEEDKNGRRNFDEIKFWVEYLNDGEALVDDAGQSGGYGSQEPFVVVGDLNAAPLVVPQGPDNTFRTSVYDGQAAIDQLLRHARIQDSGAFTTSSGALLHATATPRAAGPPRYFERSTSVFGEGSRIDYLLPSVELTVADGGVFWPTVEDDPVGAAWADEASDHRLVWLDLELPE